MVAVDSTTLLLSWNELPLPDRNGIIREYIIRLKVVGSGETTEYSAVTGPYSITDLHPDYTYSGKVAAVTAVGTGPFSSDIQVRLPEAGM